MQRSGHHTCRTEVDTMFPVLVFQRAELTGGSVDGAGGKLLCLARVLVSFSQAQ